MTGPPFLSVFFFCRGARAGCVMSYRTLQISFVSEISPGILACLRPEEARRDENGRFLATSSPAPTQPTGDIAAAREFGFGVTGRHARRCCRNRGGL